MKITDIVSRIFFPEVCPLCGKVLKTNEEFCLCCGTEETKLSLDCCTVCGQEKENCTCGNETSVNLPSITCVFCYDGLTKNKLLSFKFSHRKNLCRFFGDSVSERVAIAYAGKDFDLVTFVPASESTVKERGYNTAELIAERVSKKLFIPCHNTLIKSKETEKQHRLSHKERLTNVKGSISLNEKADIKNKTVLLCDDIKTTGSTLRECCDVLLINGAKEVLCATVATVYPHINFFPLDKEVKSN